MSNHSHLGGGGSLEATTTVPNPQLAEQLPLSSPFRLSRLAGACRTDPAAFQPYVNQIAKCKV
jgi:hypothetical protein